MGITQQSPDFNWLNYYNKQQRNQTLIYFTTLTPRTRRSFKGFGQSWTSRSARDLQQVILLTPELLFFLILAHSVYKNMNNTGAKYVRIMKQTAF
jgi:hypothetical protein